jgi:hypothetical protein
VLDPRPVHVGFFVDKLTLGQVSLSVLRFSLVNIISLLLHTHSFIIHLPQTIFILSNGQCR